MVAPFVFSDGTCFYCQRGLHSSCEHGGIFGTPFWGPHAGGEIEGGQSEFIRVPEADGTLVVIPESLADGTHDLDVLPLGDVFSTGYHGVVNARVRPGDTVAVLGDGAVGICAVQAATLFGAATIIHVGHHDDRLAVGTTSGATHVINAKREDAVEAIQNLTHGRGADAVVETISNNDSLTRALTAVRDGGAVSVLGMSHFFGPVDQPYSATFMRNISIHPGVCPSRAYMDALMHVLEAGKIRPGVVFTHDLPLADTARGYTMMDNREEGSIKVAVSAERPGPTSRPRGMPVSSRGPGTTAALLRGCNSAAHPAPRQSRLRAERCTTCDTCRTTRACVRRRRFGARSWIVYRHVV